MKIIAFQQRSKSTRCPAKRSHGGAVFPSRKEKRMTVQKSVSTERVCDEFVPQTHKTTMPDVKQKPKILVVEHDEYLSRASRENLIAANFEVISAHNGIEALTLLHSEKPGLVLLDIMVPLKNGFDVLEEIKLDKETKEIPVIIFSNLSQPSDIEKAKQLGAEAYLIKTDISMKEMVDKVREYFTKKHMESVKENLSGD